jgi:hypothetical protein
MTLRRLLLLAVLGAAVPVSAYAVDGVTPTGIDVSVSNSGCGVSDSQVLCELDASWTGVPGTEYYLVAVTRPDGSVQDFGRVAGDEEGASASLWVPYVGSGTYSVTVSAYGTPPDEDGSAEAEVIDRDSSDAGHGDEGRPGEDDVNRSGSVGNGDDEPAPGQDSNDPEPDSRGADEASDQGEPVPESNGPPVPTLPECETEEPVPGAAGDGTATAPPTAPVQPSEAPNAEAAETSEPSTPGELVECVEPSSDSQGPCCPAGG